MIILKPPPRLRLVKRITGIKKAAATSVTPLNGYVDDPAEVNDDPTVSWPGGASSRLQGVIKTLPPNTFLEPKDELEYTIYFLSDGGVNAQSVSLCDFIPQHQTFVNGSIRKQIGNGLSSPVPDGNGTSGDGFYPTLVQPACTGINNGNGSVVLDMGTIPSITTSPTQGYGQFSFRARVN